MDYYICPECGADVPVGSRGCPTCGPRKVARRKRKAKARKSWEQDSAYDGLDLPGEGYDYEEFVEREFGDKPHEQVGIAWYWWLTAVGLLGVFGWWVFGG